MPAACFSSRAQTPMYYRFRSAQAQPRRRVRSRLPTGDGSSPAQRARCSPPSASRSACLAAAIPKSPLSGACAPPKALRWPRHASRRACLRWLRSGIQTLRCPDRVVSSEADFRGGPLVAAMSIQLPSPSTRNLTSRARTCAMQPPLSTCVQVTQSVRRLPNDSGDDLRRRLNAIDQAAGLACV